MKIQFCEPGELGNLNLELVLNLKRKVYVKFSFDRAGNNCLTPEPRDADY